MARIGEVNEDAKRINAARNALVAAILRTTPTTSQDAELLVNAINHYIDTKLSERRTY